MAGNRGLPPLFGAPWEREDVEFDREAAREAAREAEQRAAQREAAAKLRGEFFRRVPDPNMPILFIPPWERAEAQGKPRRTEKPNVSFDAGEASLNQLRLELAAAIRSLNPPEYERRSSGREWVGAVPLPEFVDLVITRMLDKLVSWRPATEYHLQRLRSWGQ